MARSRIDVEAFGVAIVPLLAGADLVGRTARSNRLAQNVCLGVPSASDRHTVAVELVVLIVTALAGTKVGEVPHELDGRDPFDHFEA